MELYNIYCGFWEGMKEISVGVCLNDYTWLEIWKKKVDCSRKDQVKKNRKKNGLEQKQKKKKMIKRKKRSRSAIWDLLCKIGGIDVIWKVKLSSTSL